MRKKALLLIFLFLGLFSCNFFKQDTDKLLVTVYGDKLYFSDIKDLIPTELSSEDSLMLVQGLCEKWAKEQLLVQKAKINLPLNLQDVQSQVDSYEKSLLIFFSRVIETYFQFPLSSQKFSRREKPIRTKEENPKDQKVRWRRGKNAKGSPQHPSFIPALPAN